MANPSSMESLSAYIKIDTKRGAAGLPTKPCITDKEMVEYVYADFIEQHPTWEWRVPVMPELATDIRAYVVTRCLSTSWIEYLAAVVKLRSVEPSPMVVAEIKGKLWFVNGARFRGRYTHTNWPIAVDASIMQEQIVVNDLGDRYNVLELVGDSPMELKPWQACVAKAICAETGDATEYLGHVLEYRHGHDGMGDYVTTIRLLLQDKNQ